MAVERRETAKVILVQGNAVLLCNQAGEPIWHLPGGGIEAGESPEQTLKRELREEIGLRLSWAQPVRTLEASWSPFGRPKDTVRETMHLYMGQLTDMTREGIVKHEAGLNLRWFPIASVMPMEGPDFQVRPLSVLPYIINLGGQMQGRWIR